MPHRYLILSAYWIFFVTNFYIYEVCDFILTSEYDSNQFCTFHIHCFLTFDVFPCFFSSLSSSLFHLVFREPVHFSNREQYALMNASLSCMSLCSRWFRLLLRLVHWSNFNILMFTNENGLYFFSYF